MRTIIHDLKEFEVKKLKCIPNDVLISALKCRKHCIGCFSCWIKHPIKCALKDDFSNLVDIIKDSDELIIISKNRYGCYSAHTKRILERCIGYVLPHFTIRNKQIHHKSRYEKNLKFKTYFYGNMDEEDKITINKLVKANSINLNAKNYEINYIKNIKELKNCIL